MLIHVLTNYQRIVQREDETDEAFKLRCRTYYRSGGWRKVGKTKVAEDGYSLVVTVRHRVEARSCG